MRRLVHIFYQWIGYAQLRIKVKEIEDRVDILEECFHEDQKGNKC